MERFFSEKQITTIEQFYTNAEKYVRDFNTFAEKHHLQESAEVDHLCYKCGDTTEFQRVREILEKESDYVFQSVISCRRIAIIKLKKAIDTVLQPAYFIELSDQKPDLSQVSGFDHIEINPKGITYDDLVKKLTDAGESLIEVKRPHHTTHDISLPNGFEVKLSHGPLINKIRSEEMI